MPDGTAIALSFIVTADGDETFGPFELPDVERSYTFDVDIKAKTLRFDLTDTTDGNTGAGATSLNAAACSAGGWPAEAGSSFKTIPPGHS
jgi:hypothetical protein